MNHAKLKSLVIGLLLFPVITAVQAFAQFPPEPVAAAPGVSVSQFAPNMSFPRGLRFGPDGYLYVAEAGPPTGSLSTIGDCLQVPGLPGPGPWTGGNNGRVSKVNSSGIRTTVASGFPSAYSDVGGTLGVADVEFFDGKLFALVTGGGCSHGHLSSSEVNGVFRVNNNGSHTLFANISDFVHNNETANFEPDDFEPDGTPYSMIAAKNSLFVVEPNHGQIIKIDSAGNMNRLVDISAIFGHIVPTAAAYHGNLYVSNLNTFPIVPGSAQIMKVTPSGNVNVVATGLTTVLGVAFDATGKMYALEMNDAPGFPDFGNGKLVKIRGDGSIQTLVTNLSFPTGMTFGPDGKLYVSNYGFGPPFGEIIRVTLP